MTSRPDPPPYATGDRSALSFSAPPASPADGALHLPSTTASTKTQKKLDKVKLEVNLERDSPKTLASRLKRRVSTAPPRRSKIPSPEVEAGGDPYQGRRATSVYCWTIQRRLLFRRAVPHGYDRLYESVHRTTKMQVRSIMADFKGTSFDLADVRFAVVGYKATRIEWPSPFWSRTLPSRLTVTC